MYRRCGTNSKKLSHFEGSSMLSRDLGRLSDTDPLRAALEAPPSWLAALGLLHGGSTESLRSTFKRKQQHS